MKKTATIVTGASNGIGRAILNRLQDQGETVINLDIKAPKEESGEFHQVDLAKHQQLRAVLDDVCSRYTVLRVVNNAAVVFAKPFEETTIEDMETGLAVNMGAAMLCVNAALPAMRKEGFGRIVNICSRTVTGRATRSVYGMTKGGVLGMTRTWALEFAKLGITANAIGPGPIETELFRLGNPPGHPETERNLRSVPMARFGTPEEVAHAAAFFLDERSSFISGQILMVCGGQTLGVQPS
jgi:NAD(P)-dependent dehydrogenase (short-subunit alcohol dehydrogenase family)